jgi:hypothetical protein
MLAGAIVAARLALDRVSALPITGATGALAACAPADPATATLDPCIKVYARAR